MAEISSDSLARIPAVRYPLGRLGDTLAAICVLPACRARISVPAVTRWLRHGVDTPGTLVSRLESGAERRQSASETNWTPGQSGVSADQRRADRMDSLRRALL